MIVFISMKEEEIPGAKFAFFDTVRDRFIELSGSQAWECWGEFEQDFYLNNPETGVIYKDIERFKQLCSAWVFTGDN